MKRIVKYVGLALVIVVALVVAIVMLVPGVRSDATPDCTPTTPQTDIDTFPYHPLVYHLDLSILSYQLYSQSLIWPIDPYYEERRDRDAFIDVVRDWAVTEEGPEQVRASEGLGDRRGPGVLSGFDDNTGHDPIVYDYSRLHPWSSNVVNVEERWTEYLTPDEITSRIRDVYVAYRPVGGDGSAVVIEPIVPQRIDAAPDAQDILIAFEGGTGDKGEVGQPHSQSLMGFVLARSRGVGAGYDVHIAFRGSRSGSASRALFEALSTKDASGNPDWITDLGFRLVGADDGVGDISADGKVARGFATSVQSTMPKVLASLERVADLSSGAPKNVYVTGHSLGGGLAQHFTSAVLQGDRYGPDGGGAAMPVALAAWPWPQVKLVTFGAPRAGDEDWARPLTTDGLQAQFYDDGLIPFDRDALDSTDPEIVPRLIDPDRPAGYRVLVSTDPITNDVFDASRGVGTTVYVNLVCGNGPFGLPDFDAHEPETIRDFITLATADSRTPPEAWAYVEMKTLNPGRDGAAAGTRAEYDKLVEAIVHYHEEQGTWLDVEALRRDYEVLLSLE